MARTDPFGDHVVILEEHEQASLQSWVNEAKTQLGLSDWRIAVTRHSAEKESFAASFIRDQGDDSTIALGSNWRDADPIELRHSLTHELLHCHFQRITRLQEKLIEAELGRRTEAIILTAVSEIEEQSLDRLAWAIAAWLPLPEIGPARAAAG